MPKACPAVHLHSAFEASYNPHDKDQSTYKERLITRLKTGNQAGLKKGGDLEPLYGFPRAIKAPDFFISSALIVRRNFSKLNALFARVLRTVWMMLFYFLLARLTIMPIEMRRTRYMPWKIPHLEKERPEPGLEYHIAASTKWIQTTLDA